ncbi:hypothetical protein RB213_012016 [Colletotrichum asianum]
MLLGATPDGASPPEPHARLATPTPTCEEPGSQHGDFGSQRVCVNPSNGAGTAPVLSSCLGSGVVRCVSYAFLGFGVILTFC